jgi:hypothetical protein
VERDRNPDATEPSRDDRYRPPAVRPRPSHLRPRLRRPRSAGTLLALGALAALVALAGDGQSPPAAAAPRDPAPAGDVRQLDFSAISQPGVVCADAAPDAARRSIGVTAGESALLDDATFARLTVAPEPVYGDLGGDGREEAVVRTTCAYGANGAEDTVQVWSANGRLPMLVDTVAGAPRAVADDSRFPPVLQDVAIVGERLELTYGVFDDDAPHCCPTGRAVVTYELDGGLAVVGEADVEPID